MANVSKSISIPNEEFSDDTTPSVARKFLNETLEWEIKYLLRAVVSQDIMSIVQNNSVVDTSNLQTELEPYNDMQQKIERLQAQLGDHKGKSKDTPCVSNTLDPLPQKLENENVELEFQNKLHDTIYENAKLRAQLFNKISEQKDTTRGTSTNTKFAKQSILGKPPSSRPKLYVVTPLPKSMAFPNGCETNALSNQVTSNSVPSSQESNVVKNDNVFSPGIFRMNHFKAYMPEPEGSTQEHSTSEYKGIVPTDMELVLEQTKQGTSHEVSRSTRFYRLCHSEIVDIEKVAVRSSL
ncbi:hypothetical protein Tco_0835528 [Tanacetum coccineum]